MKTALQLKTAIKILTAAVAVRILFFMEEGARTSFEVLSYRLYGIVGYQA